MSRSSELWRECGHWLYQLGAIDSDDAFSNQKSRISDLIKVIRDGVVLCRLLHSLDHNSIDINRILYQGKTSQNDIGSQENVHPTNQSDFQPPALDDFVCRNNIFLFLHGAVQSFKLDKELYFFEPEDLFACRDVSKVFESLSALSHTPKMMKIYQLKSNGLLSSNVHPFPKKRSELTKRLSQEQPLYDQLRCEETESEYIFSQNSAIFSDDRAKLLYDKLKDYEDIYQTVFASSKSRKKASSSHYSFGSHLTSILSPQKGSIFKASPKKKDNFDLSKFSVLKELVHTEVTYVENLTMVESVFGESLRDMLTARDYSVVFHKWSNLIELHTNISNQMTQVLSNKSLNVDAILLEICDVFNKYTLPHMSDIYGSYCVNLPSAMTKLELLMNESRELKEMISKCQMNAKPSTFPLSSHLVIPFQRFLKYHLLFKAIASDYKSKFETCVEAVESLSKTTALIYKASTDVNERKRDFEDEQKQLLSDENDKKIVEGVRQSIKFMHFSTGGCIYDFGRLVRSGEVDVHPGNSTSHSLPFNSTQRISDYAFLFDMTLILCLKPKIFHNRFRFREAVKVKDLVVDIPSSTSAEVTSPTVIRLFSKVDIDRGPTLLLICKSSSDKLLWLESILTAMDRVAPISTNGHVLQLSTFENGTDSVFEECEVVGRNGVTNINNNTVSTVNLNKCSRSIFRNKSNPSTPTPSKKLNRTDGNFNPSSSLSRPKSPNPILFKPSKPTFTVKVSSNNKGGQSILCGQCDKPLYGSFFQGYRCLRCLINIHKGCISQSKCIEVGMHDETVTPSSSLTRTSRPLSTSSDMLEGHDVVMDEFMGDLSRQKQRKTSIVIPIQRSDRDHDEMEDEDASVATGGGGLHKSHSVILPTNDSSSDSDWSTLRRSLNDSTLSLAPDTKSVTSVSQHCKSDFIEKWESEHMRELECVPLEEQSWFAGTMSGKVAYQRLDALPIGTFLIRQRETNALATDKVLDAPSYALMLKTSHEEKGGVKSMIINVNANQSPHCSQIFYFSDAQSFDSLAQLVHYHRKHDLTDSFDYPSLVGVTLKTSYKDV